MQVIENSKIKEKMYIEKISNGLTVIMIPKAKIKKKYITWGVNFGSIDNQFILGDESEVTRIPDGVAHYLEHKMFEQRSGINSLDTLTNLGVDANAYTTNTYTTYLYECTDNFYEALDEFMDYVQNPYYTAENVEKERGIIEQEIAMYDDEPGQAIYMNLLKSMYYRNPINIDIAGTKESIAEIDENVLYTIYNHFYVPENMVIIACGDFDPEGLLENIKKRMIMKPSHTKITRVYEEEPDSIVRKEVSKNMEISIPIFMIGYKDKIPSGNMVRKDLALEILSEIIMGKSSKLYKRLYDEKLITSSLGFDYEYGRTFSHFLIQGLSNEPEKVISEIKNEIEFFKARGITDEDFERTKKKIYGEYVKDYNDPDTIASGVLADYFNGINSFAFLEEFDCIKKEDLIDVLNTVFMEDKKVVSIIRGNKSEEEEEE
ncbi:MAG: insulinase family protein [Clostridia bacterium]|nr:insulinase family protein [Clostridia bacterium]